MSRGDGFRSPLRRLALGLFAALSACAHPIIHPALPVKIAEGGLDPYRIVFICHGMLKDLGSRWPSALAEDLRADGVVAIPITYWSDPSGVWLQWGRLAPGIEIARLADRIAEEHHRLHPGRSLVFDGVGFSNGCGALMEAAARTQRAHFRRFVFMHSSSFAWSYEADYLIGVGRLDSLVHRWSPIDGTTILAPLGAATFGMAHGTDRVENHLHWMPHIARFIGDEMREWICHQLAVGVRDPRRELNAWGVALAELLRDEG